MWRFDSSRPHFHLRMSAASSSEDDGLPALEGSLIDMRIDWLAREEAAGATLKSESWLGREGESDRSPRGDGVTALEPFAQPLRASEGRRDCPSVSPPLPVPPVKAAAPLEVAQARSTGIITSSGLSAAARPSGVGRPSSSRPRRPRRVTPQRQRCRTRTRRDVSPREPDGTEEAS